METEAQVLKDKTLDSLNPYCNERYSWRVTKEIKKLRVQSLNPYCNERYSWR